MMRTGKQTGWRLGATAVALLVAGAAGAAPERKMPAPAIDPAREYEACTALVQDHPQAALDSAAYWAEKKKGGVLAAHCKGLAQMALGQFGGASKTFAALAGSKAFRLSDATRARLYAQAAQASIGARKPEQASAFLAKSIKLQPNIPQFRIDRSVTLGLLENYAGAVQELDAVLAKDAGNVDALTFRASAYRSLDRISEAEADIAKALVIQPDKPEALLERGVLRVIAGDIKGARQDWERVTLIVPDTLPARQALDNLLKLQSK